MLQKEKGREGRERKKREEIKREGKGAKQKSPREEGGLKRLMTLLYLQKNSLV